MAGTKGSPMQSAGFSQKLTSWALMIDRASVAMWGNARISAAAPKKPEKKILRHGSDLSTPRDRDRDFIYETNSARSGSDFHLHKHFMEPVSIRIF